MGPLKTDAVEAKYGIINGKTAVIEMATASDFYWFRFIKEIL